jgi:hypothetical protein
VPHLCAAGTGIAVAWTAGVGARWAPTRHQRGITSRTFVLAGASGKGLIERGHSGPGSGLHGLAVQCAGRPPFLSRHERLIGENSIADIRVVHTWGAASTEGMLGAGRACGTGRASPTCASGNTGRTCGVGRASSGAGRASATATAAPGCAHGDNQRGHHGQGRTHQPHTASSHGWLRLQYVCPLQLRNLPHARLCKGFKH